MFNPFASKGENPQHAGQELAAQINLQLKAITEALKDIQTPIGRILENLQQEGGQLLRQISQMYPTLISKEAYASATEISFSAEENVERRGIGFK